MFVCACTEIDSYRMKIDLRLSKPDTSKSSIYLSAWASDRNVGQTDQGDEKTRKSGRTEANVGAVDQKMELNNAHRFTMRAL